MRGVARFGKGCELNLELRNTAWVVRADQSKSLGRRCPSKFNKVGEESEPNLLPRNAPQSVRADN